MVKHIKRFLFRTFGMETYLTLLQKSYFLLYDMKLLKISGSFGYHYFVRKLIRKGDVIIDIGANLGYYSVLFARWTGTAGKVHSVEPIRIYNKVFNKAAGKYDNITLYPYALGTEEKTVVMVEDSGKGYLSTGLPHIDETAGTGTELPADFESGNGVFRFEVEMKQASKLFGELEHIDYIKCDIEGFENVVMRDIKDIIAKHIPVIQAEIWEENEGEIISMLSDLGYTPYKLRKGKLINDTDLNGDFIFLHPEHISLRKVPAGILSND